MFREIICCMVVLGLNAGPLSAKDAEPAWSAQLLREILSEQQTGDTTGAAVVGSPHSSPSMVASGTGSPTEAGGLILKSYQPRTLRLSDDARGQHFIELLTRLLPRGTSMRVDSESNTLHLLASRASHAAVWDFLSALDSGEGRGGKGVDELPPTLKAALEQLETAQKQTLRASEELLTFKKDLQESLHSVPPPEKSGLARHPLLLLLPALIILGTLIIWRTRRRPADLMIDELRLLETETAPGGGSSPADLLRATHVPGGQQRALHQEMLCAINAAALRMEAWHKEQQSEKAHLAELVCSQEMALKEAHCALEQGRVRLLADGETMLAAAQSRFEATAVRLETNVEHLGRENRRVEALAGELQSTVQELDATKDEMLRLQGALERRNGELDIARIALQAREAELTRQQAKLAALTLILEEGTIPPLTRAPASIGAVLEPRQHIPEDVGTSQHTHNDETGPDGPAEPRHWIPSDQDQNYSPPCQPTIPNITFQFLPPQHPET